LDTWDPNSGGEAYGSYTFNAIVQDPDLLNGMNPQDLMDKIGELPEGWGVEPAQSESAGLGSGWKVSCPADGGIYIRWSPGSARPDHPSDPYWQVSGGRIGKSPKIPGRTWDDGPEPYVKSPDTENGGKVPDEGGDEPVQGGGIFGGDKVD
jgi:hypothetical protein